MSLAQFKHKLYNNYRKLPASKQTLKKSGRYFPQIKKVNSYKQKNNRPLSVREIKIY